MAPSILCSTATLANFFLLSFALKPVKCNFRRQPRGDTFLRSEEIFWSSCSRSTFTVSFTIFPFNFEWASQTCTQTRSSSFWKRNKLRMDLKSRPMCMEDKTEDKGKPRHDRFFFFYIFSCLSSTQPTSSGNVVWNLEQRRTKMAIWHEETLNSFSL